MYQVLARKYRPRNFSQLVGQNHVAKALTSALERGRLHHAYLFTGTRGVGKTTIARILAKCLNCETGVTATPCETCAVCTAVNEGRFIDLIEIDAASRTGVDDTRELLNNVPYAPTQGRYKVYLIDEVHMFSNSSFNALLKTLEEPPEHVKFLFATTDPQKLPITVISRCLQFTLRPLAKDEIYQHLDNVLMSESIPHESEALWQLAESAQGSLRDALSLTDQAIAYGEGQVLSRDVKDMLGLIDKGLVIDLLQNIHQNQRQQVAQLLLDMRQQAIDVTHVLEQMISTLHDVALLQCLNTVVQDQEQIEQRKAQLAQLISPQDLQLYYQIALQGRADLALSLTPEQGFEMCVMRLLAFRPLSQHEVSVQAQAPQVAYVQAVEPQPAQIAQVALNQVADVQTQTVEIDTPALSVAESLVTEAKDFELSNHSPMIDQQSSDLAPDQTNVEKIDQTQLDEFNFSDNEFGENEVIVAKDNGAVALDEMMASEITSSEHLILDHVHVMPSDEMIVNDQASDEMQSAQQSPQALIANNMDDALEIHDPRDLLIPKEEELTGNWTLQKWDYWLRLDHLSPAVKEIAQHGILQGEIAGESILTLDPSYHRMFEAFVVDVEQALIELNASSKLTVQYDTVEQDSPYELQLQRKRDAYEMAHQKVANHPIVNQVLQDFEATITEFNLKLDG